MRITSEQLRQIIKEELEEMKRRGFLKGIASLCAIGSSQACQDYELVYQKRKNKEGMDYPSCVSEPTFEPHWSDEVWSNQVELGKGFVELDTFISQAALDSDKVYILEDEGRLEIMWKNVPRDAEIWEMTRYNGMSPYFGDEERIDRFYTDPNGPVVLINLVIKFPIFETDNVQYVGHPSDGGGKRTIPLRNSSECSRELIKWSGE